MTQPQWETIEPPKPPAEETDSPFYKWGQIAGQQITAVVLEFTPDGGTDYDGDPCPRIDLQTTQGGDGIYNIRDGMKVPLMPGDKTTWQGNTPKKLAEGLKAANPTRGDLIQLTLKSLYKTPKGTGKDIEIQIARGAGMQYLTPQQASQARAANYEAAPPF